MMYSSRSRGLMANEAIVSQFDDFPKKLDRLVELIYEQIDQKVKPETLQKSPFIDEIQNLIFDRFGLKIKLDIINGQAHVMPMYLNKYNALGKDIFHGLIKDSQIEKLIRKNITTGTVDLQNARVGGIFSEYQHDVCINFHFLKGKGLTPQEVTAVFIHELGHAFTYCYYSDRLNTTNQVLADLTRHALSSDQGSSIEYVYSTLKKITPEVKKEEVDRLLNGPKAVASVTWFKLFKESVETLMVNSFYDQTSSEERADQFVARFGRGKELVLGLDKFYTWSPYKSKIFFFYIQYKDIRFLINVFLALSRLLSNFTPGAFWFKVFFSFALSILLSLFLQRSSRKDMTYDDLKTRYLRVRNDIINQLKLKEISEEHTREFLNSIYEIDRVLKETFDLRKLSIVVADFIFLDARATQKAYTNQRLLEELSSNELFIHSAELRLA